MVAFIKYNERITKYLFRSTLQWGHDPSILLSSTETENRSVLNGFQRI
jgi:hypothetical protein